jgi:hypothetical protein
MNRERVKSASDKKTIFVAAWNLCASIRLCQNCEELCAQAARALRKMRRTRGNHIFG